MIADMKKVMCKKNASILIAVLLLLLWSEREIILYSNGLGNRLLQLVYTICMTIALTKLVHYLFVENIEGVSNDTVRKGYLSIALAQIVAFLPMYTQPFMYGDDLWGFTADFTGQVGDGLYFSRPFIKFLYGFLPDTSFQSLNYFRMFNGIVLCLFGWVLFRFVLEKTQSFTLSLMMAVISVAGCTAVDCIAYASIYPINASLLLAAISAVFYLQRNDKSGFRRTCYVFMAAICLYAAFNMYQLGTSIVFLMYCIADAKSKEKGKWKQFRSAFVFLIYYGSCAIVYLLGTKMFQTLIGIAAGQSARGQITLTMEHIVNKVNWFVDVVWPQTINQIVATLFGNSLFVGNNMFYSDVYSVKWIGTVLTIFIVVLMLASIIGNAYISKNWVYILEAVMVIPLSFWVFLVLPESTYLTYYAICFFCVSIWYVLDGIYILWRCVPPSVSRYFSSGWKKIGEYALAMLMIIVVLQSNVYSENAWVNYCRDSYEYLANNIAADLDGEQIEVNTIIVKGNISPYVGGRDYVIFAVQNILGELGYDYNLFEIRQLNSDYYISIFNDNEIDHMRQVLGDSDMDRLLAYYIHDEMYSRWLYTGTAENQDALDFMRSCFLKTGQILEDSEQTIVIDLDGFNKRNVF